MMFFWFFLMVSATVADRDGINMFNFQQNDYFVQPERLELVRYSKQFINYFDVRNFKYNRTQKAVNVTFNYKFGVDSSLQIITQAYKFMSNEYRLFPMRFQVGFCEALKYNVLGSEKFAACGNFTGCPTEKEKVYHICNWAIDQTRCPPLVPSGSYMLELQAFYHSVEVYLLRAYATITRPIV